MTTGTCEQEAGCAAEAEAELIESRLRCDLDLIDELQEFQFVWPDEDDAGIAARQAELNASTYWVARTTHQLRERQVVIASRETPEGQREAREVAQECLRRKAYRVHIWTVPGLGTQYPTMKQWATRYDLLAMLAFERGNKYRVFVSFVCDTKVSREVCCSSEGGDDTCCSASSPLPGRASSATTGCEALGTTYPHPQAWRPEREPRSRLPAPRRSGTRGAWYGQPR